MSDYSFLINKLFQLNLHGGIKLGLNNIYQIDKALGYPSLQFKSIHVAGTNGKGSVTHKIASGLQACKNKVGQFTSPHISSFRERICINGKMISEEEVEKYLSLIFSIIEREKIAATFFECTTALAFLYFAANNVDFAVLETGLGGRYDATNIITPILSVITSISFDHTDILGLSLEAIAQEKAGIIKSNVPVLLGPRLPFQIFEKVASALNAPVLYVLSKFETYEEENCAIAKKAMQFLGLSQKEIELGLASKLPCRFECWNLEKKRGDAKLPRMVIFDVAHNPDGISHLFQTISRKFPNEKIRVLFGLSKNKDVFSCLSIIKEHSESMHLIEAPNGRGVKVDELEKLLTSLQVSAKRINKDSSIELSVQKALFEAAFYDQILVVCGTFFIMRPVREAMGFKETKDFIDLNERIRG